MHKQELTVDVAGTRRLGGLRNKVAPCSVKLTLIGASLLLLPGMVMAQSHIDLSLTGNTLFTGSDYQGGGFSLTGHFSPEFALQGRFYSTRVNTFFENGFTVKDGGNDPELRLLYRPLENTKLDVAVGVSEPANYSRPSAITGTFDVGYTETSSGGKSARFSLSGIDTGPALIMAGLNFSNPAGRNGALIAQIAYPIQGQNAISLSSGNGLKSFVAKAGFDLGIDPMSKTFGELVLTNEQGITTGTSLSPMLNRRFGLQATVGVRL